MTTIEKHIRSCSELSRFCSRNGWIDGNSLRFSIVLESVNEIFVEVHFDEVLMEGAGKTATRIPCSGQLHLQIDQYGRVIRTEAL